VARLFHEYETLLKRTVCLNAFHEGTETFS
jgi:hypothetical protein